VPGIPYNGGELNAEGKLGFGEHPLCCTLGIGCSVSRIARLGAGCQYITSRKDARDRSDVIDTQLFGDILSTEDADG